MDIARIRREIEPSARLLTDGLAHEVAVMWPLSTDGTTHPVLLRAGTVSRVRLTPSDVFCAALRARADAVVLTHNHLTDPGPSPEDRAVTRRLVAAGAVVGIPLLAHLVLEPSTTYELVSGQVSSPVRVSMLGGRPAGLAESRDGAVRGSGP